MHHSAASECSPVTTVLALVLLPALQPYDIVRAAMLTRHAFLVSHFLKLATAGRLVWEILVELKIFMLLLFYKCTAKVIILIVITKSFTYYFHKGYKIIGLPCADARKFGGTIADNHFN